MAKKYWVKGKSYNLDTVLAQAALADELAAKLCALVNSTDYGYANWKKDDRPLMRDARAVLAKHEKMKD